MTTNRNRLILAQQKARQLATVQPPPDTAPKLTAEERKAIYAPKSALAIIPNRPPMPIRAVKSTAKATGWLLGMITAITGGILLSESKKGMRS
jgi:uncharacterized membrane protein